MKRLSMVLLLAVVMGCSGRSNTTNDTNNNGTDVQNNTDTKGIDIKGTDTKGTDIKGTDIKVTDKGQGGKDIQKTDLGPMTGTAIQDLQGSSDSLNCTADGFQAIQSDLTMAPVIVVSPQFVASKDKTTGDTKLYGYFVAQAGVDPTKALNGIEMTVAPEVDPGLKMGDLINVQGDYLEFYCNSELKAKAVTVKGQATAPQPLDVTPADFDNPEKLEGVLVRLKNVTVTNANPDTPKDYGNFEVGGKVLVGHLFNISYTDKNNNQRTLGDVFTSLTGVVNYTYGQYILEPRNDADMVLGSKAEDVQTPDQGADVAEVVTTKSTIADVQQSDTSKNCTGGDSGHTPIQSGLSFTGLVVISPVISSSKYHTSTYYVCDGGATAMTDYSCVTLAMKDTLDPGLAPGDLVDVTADYKEFYCNTELYATSLTKESGTATVPTAKVLTAADYPDSTAAKWEPLEGLLVKINDVTITNAAFPGTDGKDHGDFLVGGNGTTTGIVIGHAFHLDYMSTDPAKNQRKDGTNFTSITGVVEYSYGHYRISPRTEADLVESTN